MPNWKTVESFQRLLAAVVASQDLKLDYKKIATYYGEGATYDAIEGRFRIVKREAQVLKDEIENGVRAPAPSRGSTATNGTTPKRGKKAAAGSAAPKGKVLGGRVTKPGVSTKSNKAAADSFSMDDLTEDMVIGMKQGTMIPEEQSFYGGGYTDAVGDAVGSDGINLMEECF